MRKRNAHGIGSRILSLLLIAGMLLGNIPADVLAAEFTEAESPQVTGTEETNSSGQPSQPEPVTEEPIQVNNSISGIIWLDANTDGVRDAEEELLSDFTVRLIELDEEEYIVAEVTTDENGRYEFADIEQGNYFVYVEETKDYKVPKNGLGQDDKILDDGYSEEIILAADAVIEDVDGGMESVIVEEPEDTGEDEESKETAGSEELEAPEESEEPEAEVNDGTVNAKSEESEETAYENSISGKLWLDMYEDSANEIYQGDGIRQASEEALADYAVYLYMADDTANAAQTTTTDSNGNYEFTNIEPGSYVVGVESTTVGDVEYLLPFFYLSGTEGDNRFAAFYDESADAYQFAYTAVIEVAADTAVTDVDGGMRTPPSVSEIAPRYNESVAGAVGAVCTGNIGTSRWPRSLHWQINSMSKTATTITLGTSLFLDPSDDRSYFVGNTRRAGWDLKSHSTTYYYITGPGLSGGRKIIEVPDVYVTAAGTPLGQFTITGLSPNTSYYISMQTITSANSGQTWKVNAAYFTISTSGLPTATTNAATSITNTSAVVNGSYDLDGMTSSTTTFQYGTTTALGSSKAFSTGTNSSGNASASLTGLAANTTYYYRLAVTTDGGTSYGAIKTFKTLPNAPGAATRTASNITNTSATLNGGYDTKGVNGNVYFQYGTTTSYGSTVTYNASINGWVDPVPANVTGLLPNTTYHYRMVVTTTGGTAYGSDMTFKTLPNAPTATTGAASNITGSTATIAGSFNTQGGTLQMGQIWYSTNPADIATTSTIQSKKGWFGAGDYTMSGNAGTVSTTLVGLKDGFTPYYYRIVVQTNGGTVYGDIETFTTAAGTANTWYVTGDMTGTYGSLAAAITAVNGNSGSAYEIYTPDTGSETMTAMSTINAGKTVTVYSTGATPMMMVQSAADTRHLTVAAGASLTLKDIVFDGANIGGGIVNSGTLTMNNGAVIQNCQAVFHAGGVWNSGTFTMNTGAKIINNMAPGAGGGVVSAGTFDMQGGEISGNTSDAYGGGVHAYSGGTFTMQSGAVIRGNTAVGNGGGVHILDLSTTFTMNTGAKISGNTALHGGGVISNGGTFDMQGGEISGNTAANNGGGVNSYNGGIFTMQSGEISGNTATSAGGGVFNAGTFDMQGGEISGNTAIGGGGGIYNNTNTATLKLRGSAAIKNNASGSNGGGVVNQAGGIFTMEDSAVISGNKAASSGGGVLNYASTFDMQGGEISDNTAVLNGGGMVNQTGGISTMRSGAEISGNTAGNAGGGVLNYNSATFDMQGGAKISGNTAAVNGGGVYTYSGSTFNMQGGEISGNTATTGNGGGVHTDDPASYASITIAAGAVFSGNTASVSYTPPVNAATYFPTILTTNASNGFTHPLNNDDINRVEYKVTVHYLADDSNNEAPAADVYDLVNGDDFELAPADIPEITNCTFIDWKIGESGTLEGNTTVTLGNVQANTDIYLVYQPVMPEAAATGATNIGTTSATLNGTFDPKDARGASNLYRIWWGTDPTLTTYQIAYCGMGGTAVEPDIWTNLVGLNPNTTYYYRVSIRTAGGQVESNIESFTTLPDFVTWGAKANPSDFTEATVAGDYYVGETITAATVTYGKQADLSDGTKVDLGSGDFSNTDFSYTLTGLDTEEIYYVQTTVTNASGTTTSTIKSFSTGNSIIIEYVDRDGNDLIALEALPDMTPTSELAAAGSSYTISPPAVDDYVFVDWELDGVLQGSGATDFTVPTGTTTLTYIYGYDFDGDGTEELPVTESHYYNSSLLDTTVQFVNKGSNYTGVERTDLNGYVYTGYDVDNGGDTGVAPALPTITNVTGAHEVTYNYGLDTYTVIFKDYDGTVLDNQTYSFGDSITVPTEPTRASDAARDYVFAGWTPSGSYNTDSTVAGDMTFTAKYVEILADPLTVIFYDEDGTTILYADTVAHGESVTAPTASKASDVQYDYTFASWSPAGSYSIADIGNVTEDMEFTAGYTSTVRSYQVTFLDYDGTTVLKQDTLAYGSGITQPGTPTRTSTAQYDYTFSSWIPTGSYTTSDTVAGDMTFTADYTSTTRNYGITIEYKNRLGTVLASADSDTEDYGNTYTVTDPGFTNYVLVDWKLDGTAQGNTTVAFTVSGAATVTLIYGQDNGATGDIGTGNTPDGIEDIMITKAFKDTGGTTLKASVDVVVNVGDTFSDAADAITGYTYFGYTVGALLLPNLGTPNIAVAAGDLNTTVTYIYSANTYNITIAYEDRAGNDITPLSAPTADTGTYQQSYTATVPSITNYMLVDWKLDSAVQGNTTPTFTMPAGNAAITLIYGQDNGSTGDIGTGNTPDGIEDIIITKEFQDSTGTTIASSVDVVVNVGDTFSDAHDTISGYTYLSYRINSGSRQSGAPAITVAAGDVNATVTYIYHDNSWKDVITANDFEWGVNQDPISDNDARTSADVQGSYYTATPPGTAIDQSDMAVDSTLLGNINTQIANKVLGRYNLSFTTPTTQPPRPAASADPKYSAGADIKVTLYQYGDVGTERIYGNDFLYAVGSGSLSDTKAKELAQIIAREADLSLMALNKVQVNLTELNAINDAIDAGNITGNPWPLTFETPAGESITVNVSLYQYIGPNPPAAGNETIAANDFAFGMDQGALADDAAKFLAGAAAKDASGNDIPVASITVDAAELLVINTAITNGDKSNNPYDLTFISPGGETVTVQVTLKDHSNPPSVGAAIITGNDFSYAAVNGALGADTAKVLAEAAAKDADGIPIARADIAVDSDELDAINAAIAAGKHTTLPLTFTEPGGEQATVNVTIYDNGPQPPVTGEEAIYGNNFSYGISSGIISADTAKLLAGIYAHDAGGNEINLSAISVDAGDLAVINTAIAITDKSGNPFDLTFATAGGKEVTVKVTLKDNGPVNPPAAGDQYITGNDFAYGLDQGALSADNAKILADMDAKNADGSLMDLSDVTVDAAQLQAINDAITAGDKSGNPFDLTFKTPDGTSVTVQVTLYDRSNPPAAGTASIAGNDFRYAAANGAISESMAKTLAEVTAKDADGAAIDLANVSVDGDELQAVNDAITAGKNMTLPLTFTEPTGENVTVYVTLYDNGPQPPVTGEEAIYGSNFGYGINNGALTADNAKILANVYAHDALGSKMNLSAVTVDTTKLAAINAAIAAEDKSGNPFDLTFETPGGKEVTVQVTLYDNSNPPAVGSAVITGNDFHYASVNGALSDDMARALAAVAAKDADGVRIDTADISVDPVQLQTINDAIAAGNNTTFPLTFTEPDGESVTIHVTLHDNGSQPPVVGREAIYGNDFSYGISSGIISVESAKLLAAVYAHDAAGNEISASTISVDIAELAVINAAIAAADQSGNPFDLTFLTTNGKEVTVKVTLKDNGPVNPPAAGEEYITGNDFGFGLDQGALTEANAKFLAQLDARNADGTKMELSNVNVDGAELQAINDAIAAEDKSGNPFDLTFSTPDGTSVTVQVTLYDHSSPTPQPDETQIRANDFVYGIDQGAIDADGAKMLSNVNAVDGDVNPIDMADIAVDADELQAINDAIASGDRSGSPLNLTFSTPDGTSVTVQVTLYDHINPNPQPGETQIAANDFAYGIDQGALDADAAKVYAGVNAVDEDGNAIDLADVTVDAAQLAAINTAITAADKSGNPFDLTFSTTDGTAVTVQVTLKDYGTGVVDPTDPGNNTDRITGNDFVYGTDQPEITPDTAKELAGVTAVDKDGNPYDLSEITADAGELQNINNAITAGDKGDYSLTFSTPDGTSVTVTVTLKEHGSGTVDPADPSNNTERIAANGFLYGINEGDLTEAAAKYRSQVIAADKDGGLIDRADILTDAGELAAINAAIKAGTSGGYPLTYSTPDGTAVTVTVTLKDHAVEPDEDVHETGKTVSGNIGANDFIYGISEVQDLTADEAKLRGRAEARDMSGNNYDLAEIHVDTAELAAINAAKAAGQTGTYPLTYTSPEGKSVTVQVTLLDEVNPPVVDPADPSGNKSSIGASDFNYSRDQGELTADKAKELAEVTAKDKDGANIPTDQIDVDQNQLDAINNALANGENGKYPLTFTEPDGKTVTIEVEIWDHLIVNPDPDNQQEMAGNDFDYDIDDGKLTGDKAKELADVTAYDKDGNQIPLDQIHADQDDLDRINEAIQNGETGEYELTFTTDDGQEITVIINVYDGSDPNSVEIRKVDESGKLLAGAKLALYDADGEEVDSWTSTADSRVLEDQLTAGAVYTLKELAAPEGYLLAADITFTAPAAGKSLTVTMTDLTADDGVIQINKSVIANAKAYKVTDTFYFTLYSDEEMKNIIATKELSLREAAAGTATFSDLAYGSYYISESDKDGSPVGDDFKYKVSISDAMVTLSDNSTVTVDIVNDLGKVDDSGDQNKKPASSGSTGKVATTAKSGQTSAVKTGDAANMTIWIILAGAALMMVITVFIYRKRQRKS